MIAGQVPSYLRVPGTAGTAAATGGAISGTVTDDTTAASPLPNVVVHANNADGGALAGSAVTDAQGKYSISVPDGTYDVSFNGAGYAPQTYNGQKSSMTATPVTVSGLPTTGIDAHLSPAVYLSGTVSDATGAVLSGIAVDIYIATDGSASGCCYWVAGTTTGAVGTYNVGLAAGATYKVRFAGNTPLEQWWNGHPNPGNNTFTGWTSADAVSMDPIPGGHRRDPPAARRPLRRQLERRWPVASRRDDRRGDVHQPARRRHDEAHDADRVGRPAVGQTAVRVEQLGHHDDR